MSKDPDDALELARDILRYFVRNPEAADTIEGVARWRLLDEKIHSTMQEVKRAMVWLAAQGLVVEDQLPSSRTSFRLNRDAMLQIEQLLRRGKPGGTKKKIRRN